MPLFGRDEDAADQFSTYIMLGSTRPQARRLIMGSAYQYKGDVKSATVTMARQKFADEHGTPVAAVLQRALHGLRRRPGAVR